MSDFEQLTQKYKKKVEVVDERSTPEARAARVKRLRNLANLSRKEMCEDNDLNVSTLKGWEIARYGGLPLDGAHKIIKRVAREGVLCTVEWLLYEDGQPPRVNVGQTSEPSIQDGKKQPEEVNIDEELTLFQHHYPAAIHYQISDDSMSPFYEENDVVAGIKKTGKQIDDLVGSNCIVQLATGQLLCRRLRKGKTQHSYHLACLNVETSVEAPNITDVELLSAARVIWHRKNEATFINKTNISAALLARQIAHDICSPTAALQVLLTDSKSLNATDQNFLRNILDSLERISNDCLKKG